MGREVNFFKPKRRLGRMRRVRTIGIIIPVKGGEIARKSEGKIKESEEE